MGQLTRRHRACVAITLSIAVIAALSACSTEPTEQVLRFPEPPAGSQAVAAPRVEPSTPEQVRNRIYRWFLAAGYPSFQAAALVDHAAIESGFRPCAAGAAGLRYTYQWGGRRLERLYQFSSGHSCPPLDQQLAFANDELRHDPKFSCFLETKTRAAALAALRQGFGGGRC